MLTLTYVIYVETNESMTLTLSLPHSSTTLVQIFLASIEMNKKYMYTTSLFLLFFQFFQGNKIRISSTYILFAGTKFQVFERYRA
jgi:hypothetical protein